MTFEQFQSTRRYVTDISAETGIDFGCGAPLSGFVYCGDLHIFHADGGAYELVLFSEATVSSNLAALELKLFEFASDEYGFN